MAERGMVNRQGRQISKQAVDKIEEKAIKKLAVKLKNRLGIQTSEAQIVMEGK